MQPKTNRPMASSNDARDLAFQPEGITSVPNRGELRADPAEGSNEHVS
jgi:hypothetical protein